MEEREKTSISLDLDVFFSMVLCLSNSAYSLLVYMVCRYVDRSEWMYRWSRVDDLWYLDQVRKFVATVKTHRESLN
jgi:hypothetical protein